MTKEALWLNRDLHTLSSYAGLCLTEEAFHGTLQKLGVKSGRDWVTPGFNASTHYLEGPDNKRLCLVCFRQTDSMSLDAVYALLVHEAVHVWQDHCESIGETHPSKEFEAYSIQTISQELFNAYEKLTRKGNRKRGKKDT